MRDQQTIAAAVGARGDDDRQRGTVQPKAASIGDVSGDPAHGRGGTRSLRPAPPGRWRDMPPDRRAGWTRSPLPATRR